MSMPLAVSFIASSPSLSCRSARADLVVRTESAGLIAGRGLEAPRPDAGCRLQYRPLRLGQVLLGRHVTPGEARLEETQLHPGGQPSRRVPMGQSIHLQLEALPGPTIGDFLVDDVAGLVVHDHGAAGLLVDPVEPPPDARGAEPEHELLLHRRRLAARGFLLVVEARERLDACALALLLVLAREKALVLPGVLEGAEEVLQGSEVPHRAPPQIELHRGVQCAAVNDRVVLP